MTNFPLSKKSRARLLSSITFIVLLITTNYATATSPTSLFSENLPPCDNVTNAGTISGTQSSCGSFYPTTLTSVTPASGGTGPVEYQWMYKNASTGWSLTAIPGATSASYTPGFLSETTKFRRCARNQGCSSWPGETADITITVTNVCCNVTNAGSIGNAQTSCGAFDPAPITSIAPASGGTNLVEYVWMYKNASTSWNFQMVSGATGVTYDPGLLTETTTYRRCARNEGCTSWPGETNDITMTVYPAISASVTSTLANCSDTIKACDIIDYNGSRTVWMPCLGGTSGTSLFTVINNSGKLYQFADGTAHFVAKVEKTNDANKQWAVSIWFKDKKDWTAWSAGGGGYKNGGGNPTGYQSWDYYIMDPAKPNKMTGLLDYKGVELDLTHKPANHDYAMQLGTGANDQDGDFGMSFWFDYTSSDPAFSSGTGDFNTDATCNDYVTCEAIATATVTGGVAPYVYSWSNGLYGNEAKGLCAGNYTVTIDDANGCSTSVVRTVAAGVCCDASDILPGTIGSNQSGCGPFDPATITSLTPATSSGTVEYLWMMKNASTGNNWVSTGVTTASYDPGLTSETTEYIRCARNQGCTTYPTETNVVTITVYPALDAPTISTVDVLCNGNSTGSATVTVTGGTPPYNYLWSDGQTTATASNLTAGTYTVLVADANNCSVNLNGANSIVITEPTVLDASTISITSNNVSCNGLSDGSATATVTGGTAPYTYLWSDGQTTATASNLAAGTYTVLVTDANNCSFDMTGANSVTITEPTVLNASTISISSTDVSCNGGNDGSATATVTGGTAPYTYLWSDGQTTATASNLAAGTYTILVTDANNCSFDMTGVNGVTITEPTVLNASTISISSTDVSCNGGNDGSATATVTGGTAPYTYLWSDGQTTATASNLAAGTYTVLVTDANNCSFDMTGVNGVTITEPTVLNASTISISSTDVSCNGGNDGSATVTVTGGTAPYTYLWSDGQTTATASNLAAGTYTVLVTDANNCSFDMTGVNGVTITEPTVLNASTISITSNNVSCNGGNDGSATATVTGGTAPYTYLWSDGQTTATASNLAAGTYTVLVTDANNCSFDMTGVNGVTITEPTVLNASTISISSTDVSCNGGNDGSATVTVTGGTAPYTYLWSDGQTTATASNLTAGTYTVLVTDANNCSFDMTGVNGVTITEPTVLNASTISITSNNVSCNGGNDGSATATVTGGTAPYTYLWSDGQTTATASNLAAGTYTVLVTDANNCSFDMTGVNGVTITEPTVLNASTISISSTDVSCNGGNDGSATVTVTGGTAPYTYLWSDGQTTATASNLAAGTYTVLVTDANNCSFDMTGVNGVTITEPTVLNASTISISSTDVSCNGGNDGSATATVTGGTAPYTYLWSDGQTTATASNLTAGTYTVLVTDANNCSFDMTGVNGVTITEPTVLNASTISISSTDVSCNGGNDGSATVTVTGGTAPYTYLWSDGQTTATASNLAAGTYTVLVTDANNCSFDMTGVNGVTITEPTVLNASTISISSTDVSCNGGNDGSATVTVTGGTAPYTYLWSDGQTTATASNLTAGTYTVLVTDANNCSFDMTGVNGVTITEPTVLNASTISISSTDVSCNGGNDGSATATVTGGTAPYTYLWSDGQTTATASNLAAGTYTVLVTDANNCSFDMTGANSVTITEPTVLNASTISISSTDVSCNGGNDGSATVTVTGGTAPYTYLWSDGQTTATASNLAAGTYTVLVTDANNCSFDMTGVNGVTITEPLTLVTSSITSTDATGNGVSDGTATITVTGGTTPYTYLWNDGQTTATATNLAAGTYNVTVTDANGCTVNESIVVNEPNALLSSTTTTDALCNGDNTGSATVSVTGGVSPYTYLWSDGQTTATASNLSAGNYSVTVTDANGYTTSSNATVNEPTLLTGSTTTTDALCNGDNNGSASISVSGGTAPYTYLWSDGQTTATATGLTAGSYSVTATDANGCTVTESATVSEPVVLAGTTSSVDALCNGDNNGSANVIATGGTAPYTYLWSDGQTTATATGLTAGSYSVLITDANGCTITKNANVGEPAVLNGTINKTDALCNGDNNGSATVSATGGTTPYTYLWNDGQTTATASNLTAGNYSVTVTDANGCNITLNITISEPTTLVSTATNSTDATGNGVSDGTASITVSGGTPPYAYLWSDGQTTATATGLPAGTYTVTVTDANSCSITKSVTVNEPAPLMSSVSTTNALCNGDSNGSATVSVTGGVGPYTYLWSDGQTTATASNLSAGNYSVTVTDANGYTTSSNATITEPVVLAGTTSKTDALCNGDNNGSATINVTGGTTPYTYLWNDGQTTATASNLTAGTYNVTVTDANGCTINETIIIDEPLAFVSTGLSINDALCSGDNNGSAEITVSGGTAPYTYLWSDGQTTAIATGLTAGTYSVTVTDANGCTVTESGITVGQPALLASEGIGTGDATCFGACDGTAAISIDGGTFPFTYLWSNGQTTPFATGLCADSYSVTVTDANGCTLTETNIIIDEPSQLTATTSSVPNLCNGDSNGSASVVASGGTAPYTYAWSNGETTSSVTGLPAGAYSVTVTDANGCQVTENVTVTEPMVLSNISTTITGATCFGDCDGSITVNITGGTAPYTYEWSMTLVNQITGDGTPTITNLCKGLYHVLVTDANGCTLLIENIEIFEPGPLFNNNTTLTNVSCNGGSDGSIGLEILGGTPPYNYAWSDGQSTATATGLSAGTYSVTITDVNGCIFTINSLVVNEPSALVNQGTIITDVTCFGLADGSISVNIDGGTAPYTYLWNDGQTTATATGLIAGTYSVTVTDANGCVLTLNNIDVNQPTLLENTATTVTHAACFGDCNGSISVNITGGTAPYTYAWSEVFINQINGDGTPTITDLCKGMFSVLVTDANGCTVSVDSVEITEPAPIFNDNMVVTDVTCNGGSDGSIALDIMGGTAPYTYTWSNGDQTSTITDLTEDVYSAMVVDANGCTFDVNNVVINQPAPMVNTGTVNNISCNSVCDGSIQLSIAGGTAPYTYSWDNGETTSMISGLCVGSYVATITDINGCTLVEPAVQILEPAQLSLQMNSTDVNCYTACDGTADAIVTGGTMPYTYSWNTGQNTASLTNLCNDTYTVNITDSLGCTAIDSVVITQPEELKVIAYTTDITCFGSCDGTANAVVTGGTMPYVYNWSNGDSVAYLSDLCGGSYLVSIHDANNCIVSASAVITEPAELMVQLDIDYTAGSIQATPINGVGFFTYSWNTGSTGTTISNLTDGATYTVTITDANGCSVTDSIVYVDGGGVINQFTINVGPNPFNTQSKLSLYTTESTTIMVDVFDMQGNIIENEYNGSIEEHQLMELVIEGNSLEPGMYMVRILAEDGSLESKKIILTE